MISTDMKTVQGRRHTGILDPTGCYNKTLPTMPFINHTHLFLTILKARKSKLQATVIGCLPYKYTKLYSCNLQHNRRVKATPQGPLYKGANPVMRVLPPRLISFHQYIGDWVSVYRLGDTLQYSDPIMQGGALDRI